MAAPGNADLRELSDVIRTLNQNYIDQSKLTPEELNRAAIQGIIEYLDDPYTSYLPPERYDRYRTSLAGETRQFEGIGAQVTKHNGDIMILGPLPGSPASRAGIRAGDVVLEVNGTSVADMELVEAVALIRGPKGTEVTLRVARLGETGPIEITVVRDEIELTTVSARMQADGIGVIHLASLDAKTVDNLRLAIQGLRDEGAEGIVLDLRFNSGGLLDAAIGVVSEFVETGTAVIWQEADGTERVREVTGEGTAYDIPLVVITNSFTASGAEIVTGALQDHNRATVVGTTTFGKGSVNLLSRLDSGAGMTVTTARWLTPDGRIIEGAGLSPDIEVPDSFALLEGATQRIDSLTRSLCETFERDGEELEAHPDLVSTLESLCELEVGAAPLPEGDAQLAKAVETLRAAIDRQR